MEKEQEPTQEAHSEASHVNAADGNEAVTEAVDPLKVINEVTGREYKDLDSAKESLKEMQKEASSTGNLKKEIETLKSAPQTDEELRAVVAELTNKVRANETDNFFTSNPEHASNRSLLEKIAKADGVSLSEAVASSEYQAIAEAQSTVKETQSMRTVADSNARVAQSQGDEGPPAAGDRRAAADYVTQNFFKKD